MHVMFSSGSRRSDRHGGRGEHRCPVRGPVLPRQRPRQRHAEGAGVEHGNILMHNQKSTKT